MANIIPCLTSIECRWKPEIIGQPDVLQMNDGTHRDITKPTLLQQELKLRFDWFLEGGEQPLFYREFIWGAEKVPANQVFHERVPASELIGKGSIFDTIANDLFKLAESELNPEVDPKPYAMRTYLPASPVSRLRINLPYASPRERIVEVEVINYLDNDCRLHAYKTGKQWLGRGFITERGLEGETPCEELLNNELIEPNVIKALKKSAELAKSIFPTFNIDIDVWMALAEATIDSYNPQPAEELVGA